MSSDNIEHLKGLVSQLQAKIERLEKQAQQTASDAKHKVGDAVDHAKDAVKGTIADATGSAQKTLTPAQHLRLVLMGPPGAGELRRSSLAAATGAASWTARTSHGLSGALQPRGTRARCVPRAV
jgi:uncharacterized protein YjbJ (UPF0337 family)